MTSSAWNLRNRTDVRRRRPADSQILPWGWVCVVLMPLSVSVVVISAVTPLVLGVALDAWAEPGRAWFDVGNENNLPTWWNAALLMLGATLAAAVGCVCWMARGAASPSALAWWPIALLLTVLSLDEVASLHERLGRLAEAALPDHGFTYAWLAIGIPLALVLLVGAVYLTRSLPAVPRRLFLAGLLLLFTGAVGLEAANDLLVRAAQPGATHNPQLFHLIYHAEELLELLGACLMVAAPLSAVRITTPQDDDVVAITPR